MTGDEPQCDPELRAELDKCLQAGNYLIVLVRRERSDLQLRRFTRNFSIADFDPAMGLLQKNLQEERDRLISENEE